MVALFVVFAQVFPKHDVNAMRLRAFHLNELAFRIEMVGQKDALGGAITPKGCVWACHEEFVDELSSEKGK